MVQVDVDATAIGVHRPVDIALQADASVTATLLDRALEEREGWTQTGLRNPALTARILDRDPGAEFTVAPAGERLDPRALTVALDRLLPEQRTVTIDSGHFMGWPAKYLSAPDAAGFIYPQSFQCVGLGLGAAIGAAVARPDRISVLTIGDGGMMLSPQELDTAVRNRLALLVLVYNDSAYGAEVHRFQPMGLEVDLVEFPERDFAAMAVAVGAQSLTVSALEDLDSLGEWLREPDGPMVVDLKIDPTVLGDWIAGNSKAALS